jgi:regulatory protein
MPDNLLIDIALKKAMTLCAGREYCYSEIRQKLHSWGVKSEDSDKILNLLTDGRFIDEERYSIAFAKDKFKYNKWGKVKISSALRMKRISDERINIALNSIDDAEYIDLLKTIIEKQKRTVKAKNQYDLKGKLLRHCLSKGFESHLVYDLLKVEEWR